MEFVNYHRIAIAGAFRLDPAVTTLDVLRERTEAVRQRMAPVTIDTTVEDDGIIISRELAKEILGALDSAEGFAGFIPRRIGSAGVVEWAESVRRDSEQAAIRLRRVANLQGALSA